MARAARRRAEARAAAKTSAPAVGDRGAGGKAAGKGGGGKGGGGGGGTGYWKCLGCDGKMCGYLVPRGQEWCNACGNNPPSYVSALRSAAGASKGSGKGGSGGSGGGGKGQPRGGGGGGSAQPACPTVRTGGAAHEQAKKKIKELERQLREKDKQLAAPAAAGEGGAGAAADAAPPGGDQEAVAMDEESPKAQLAEALEELRRCQAFLRTCVEHHGLQNFDDAALATDQRTPSAFNGRATAQGEADRLRQQVHSDKPLEGKWLAARRKAATQADKFNKTTGRIKDLEEAAAKLERELERTKEDAEKARALRVEQAAKFQALQAEESDLAKEVAAAKITASDAAAGEILAGIQQGGEEGNEVVAARGIDPGIAAAAATTRITCAAKVKVHAAVAKALARPLPQPDTARADAILSQAGHVRAALEALDNGGGFPSIEMLQRAMVAAQAAMAPPAEAEAAEHPEANSKKRGRVEKTAMEQDHKDDDEELEEEE